MGSVIRLRRTYGSIEPIICYQCHQVPARLKAPDRKWRLPDALSVGTLIS